MTENPGIAVEAAVRRSLELAATWINWDGRPRVDEDGDRVYTPHKAVRRIADHLIDHLAEAEALLAGVDTQPDAWHGSLLTLESGLGTVHRGRSRRGRTAALPPRAHLLPPPRGSGAGCVGCAPG